MIFEQGMKVVSITLPDGTKLSSGAPHRMEIIMETGPHCAVPWVRRWNDYGDTRYNCAAILSVELVAPMANFPQLKEDHDNQAA